MSGDYYYLNGAVSGVTLLSPGHRGTCYQLIQRRVVDYVVDGSENCPLMLLTSNWWPLTAHHISNRGLVMLVLHGQVSDHGEHIASRRLRLYSSLPQMPNGADSQLSQGVVTLGGAEIRETEHQWVKPVHSRE